jgi:AraC-like DNA-binding protein
MQRVGGFHALPGLLRHLGADPRALLAAIDLPDDALEDAEARLPYDKLARLLHDGARATQCPHLGVLAGRLWHLDDFGVLRDVMRNSRTLGEALRSFTVFQHLYSESALAFLLQRERYAEFGYATYAADGPGIDLMHDCALALGANQLRELVGNEWRPAEVLVAHTRPSDVAPWRSAFGVLPRFNAEVSALRFPRSWLDRAIPGADPACREQAWRAAEGAGRGDFVEQVTRALRRLLIDGRFAGDDIADHLAMHRRTLNRRLKTAGTTFRDVLDGVRCSVARELLADTALGLDDIAASLGYAGVTPFMRAFRRWTGGTPGQWRSGARPPG